jgi:tRNA(fMet)-specific endonuclease VapC
LNARFLLDTNIISELARPAPDQGVINRLRSHELVCAISAPTVEELAFGVARLAPSRKRDLLERWLEGVVSRFEVLCHDTRCAMWLGRERARLRAEGLTPSRVDGEIASVALINALVLVTRNTTDFQNFAGLKMENWFGS